MSLNLQSLSRSELRHYVTHDENDEAVRDTRGALSSTHSVAELCEVLLEYDRRLSVEKVAWGKHLPRLHAAEAKAADMEERATLLVAKTGRLLEFDPATRQWGEPEL